MTEDQKAESRLDLGFADQRSLAAMVDASLRRGSGLSIALSDATVGVSLDKLGDWTITVGLSSRSDRFRQSISSLERLGFFKQRRTKVACTCSGRLSSPRSVMPGLSLSRLFCKL